MYVALLPAYPYTAQTNKYTVKTGISVYPFKMTPLEGVKLKYGLLRYNYVLYYCTGNLTLSLKRIETIKHQKNVPFSY